MSDTASQKTSRREFLKNTTKIAAASAIAGPIGSRIYAAENNTIKIALVGCGGRGTGAALQALSVKNGPTKLVAMADVFQNRLDSRYELLLKKRKEKVDVTEDRRFLGFDGYKKAIDCLGPGDVVILATPPAFRWVHFAYAIKKGVNVFMEKPVTVDGPSTRKMLKLAEESEKKNLKVGVGLMVRHCRGRRQLLDRIKSGEIGEIIMLRASLVSSMGRMAAHTGQIITYDQILNCPHEFAPDVDKLTMDSPAPLQLGSQGHYPYPNPGIIKDREY